MLHSRDCFARQEIHSTRVYRPNDTCKWCGGIRMTKTGREWLYAFRVESDGGKINDIDGLFCSKNCMKTYYGG